MLDVVQRGLVVFLGISVMLHVPLPTLSVLLEDVVSLVNRAMRLRNHVSWTPVVLAAEVVPVVVVPTLTTLIVGTGIGTASPGDGATPTVGGDTATSTPVVGPQGGNTSLSPPENTTPVAAGTAISTAPGVTPQQFRLTAGW
jgi:hypothetical protein